MRFDRSGLVSDDPDATEYVNRVASKLIPDSARTSVGFRILVLKHPIPNAFALPHGVLYVHTGMLARMENEAQLAAVLAHEISHVIRRHTLQTFRSVKQAAAFASTLAVIGAPAGLPGTAVVLLGTVGALAAVSGYSQGMEEEADTDGLRLMASAGYHPAEAVKVIEHLMRYAEQDEIKEPFFFSSHPRLEERRASYQRLVETEYFGKSGFKGKEEFTQNLARTILDNALLEMARGRYQLAQEGIENCIAVDAKNCKAHFALAELLRQRGLESDQEKAAREYLLAIQLEPRFGESHRGLGLLYYKAGHTDLAKQHFMTYLELNPAAKDRAYIEQYLHEIETGRAAQ
jgi:predicted Zn-dependent protease